jgi:hypothetical protein
MSTTQDNAVQAGAEVVMEAAKDIGSKCGLPSGTEAAVVMERALAISWADVAHFRGANDTPERLEEVCKMACERLTKEIKLQHFLRRGHAPFKT